MSEADHKDCRRYKVRYWAKYEPEGVCKHELKEGGEGGTDVLAVASMLFPSDGSLSVVTYGLDGRTGDDVSDEDWFRVFAALAYQLSKSTEFPKDSWRQILAKEVHEKIKAKVTSGRNLRLS